MSRRTLLAWLPALGYASLIFAISSIPAQSMPDGRFWDFDKLIHAVEYAILGLLCWWPLRWRHRLPPWPAALASFAVAAMYGVTDELHQLLVPGRYGSAGDAVADAVGAAAAVALASVFAQRRGVRLEQ